MIKIIITSVLLFSPTLGIAQSNNNNSQEGLPNLDNNPTNTSALNEQLRQLQSNIQAISNGSYTGSDSISLSGTNFTLTNDSASPGNSKVYGTDGSGIRGWYTASGGGSIGIGTANTIAYWNSTSTIGSLNTGTYPSLTELSYVKGASSNIQTQINSKVSSQWTTTNTHDVYLPSPGNVGIGTWKPEAIFQVRTNSPGMFGTYSVPAFNVAPSGNVGLGTFNPEDLLVVVNTVNSQVDESGYGGITIDDGASVIDPSPHVIFKDNGSAVGTVETTSQFETDYGGFPNDSMGIFTANGMYLDPSGNAGFQIVIPAYAVDIADNNSTGYDIGDSSTGDWYIDANGNIMSAPLKATTGNVFVCANTSGVLVPSATACVGTL